MRAVTLAAMAGEAPIRVVAYDPSWPRRFEAERGLLLQLLGEHSPGGVHHVGSTAVPGMAAKPTIDIMAGVAGLADSRACFEPLSGAGYQYAPYRAEEMHWFCKPDPVRRTFHLHLVPCDSRRFRAALAFRDALRSDPACAAEYATLKLGLAERFAKDRDAYTEAKANFILAVCARALDAD
ncbi:MAG TPA: GrpB family protein [Solirubrobacteraceae bacterium]|jgi:GrpB-like predicted nucleotidyltransferase (UPF0157 family)|nr:GrpB family protein [Solirubrobacteraceae bacterium]